MFICKNIHPIRMEFYINDIMLNERYTCCLIVGFLNLKLPGARVTDLSRELNTAYSKSSTLVPPNFRGAIFRCELGAGLGTLCQLIYFYFIYFLIFILIVK